MATKKLIIFGLIFFLIFAIIYLFFMLVSNRQPERLLLPTGTPLPMFFSPTISSVKGENKINIGNIEVNNFYTVAKTVTTDKDVIITDNGQYQINYYGKGEYFQISILQPPFDEVRKMAENDFIKILGISGQEACLLPVTVSTPQFANPAEAGQTYRLSFCQ